MLSSGFLHEVVAWQPPTSPFRQNNTPLQFAHLSLLLKQILEEKLSLSLSLKSSWLRQAARTGQQPSSGVPLRLSHQVTGGGRKSVATAPLERMLKSLKKGHMREYGIKSSLIA